MNTQNVSQISKTRGSPSVNSPLLELKNITKVFPGVKALDTVSFTLNPGEVHVLFGENGAGKSTLISTISGVYQQTEGDILFKGENIKLQSVHHAKALGISVVFQEFSLVEELSVEENIFLGHEHTKNGFLHKKKLHDESVAVLNKLNFALNPHTKVKYLSRANQQMVEIAKAFSSDLSVLILDEPTASLTEREIDRLFKLIKHAQQQGIGIIYITHRIAEIKRIADRVTVLRDGKYIDTVNAQNVVESDLITLMMGEQLEKTYPKISFNPGKQLLKIENLTTADGRVKNTSIVARAGEVVGLAGLVGAGKSKLLRACFGLETILQGMVIFKGEDVTNLSPKKMIKRGLFYSPSDRKSEGLVIHMNCRENITLSAVHLPMFKKLYGLDKKKEKNEAHRLASLFNLFPLNIDRTVQAFSGGNQQKVMLAKPLIQAVDLYVFDEPTVGVDVKTRAEIYKFIAKLCKKGAGVIIISSDLPEVVNLSHRLYVMQGGNLKTELTGKDITQQMVLANFFDMENV